MKKIYVIITICIILWITMSMCSSFKIINNDKSKSDEIIIESFNKIYFKEIDTIFTLNDSFDSVTFKAITEKGEIDLFKINYKDLYEPVKYKLYNNYIYFWLNGYNNETLELNLGKPNKELRTTTNVRVFRYDIITSKLEQLSIPNQSKSIIKDIIVKNDEFQFIREEAIKQDHAKQWKGIKTYIGNNSYDFSITNYYLFDIKSIVIDNKVYIPTYKNLTVIENNKVIKNIDYPVNGLYRSNLYEYNDKIINIIESHEYTYITKYNNQLDKIDDLKTYQDYKDEIIIDNKIFLYEVLENEIIVDCLELGDFKHYNVAKTSISIDADSIEVKYNKHDKILIFYDKSNNDTLIELNIS